MPFQLTVHHGPELVVEASGDAKLCDLMGLMDFTAQVATQCGHRRALLDLFAVHPTLTFSEHLTFGAHTAMTLRGLDKAASVVHPDFRTGSSEKAAQKSGLQFRTFTDASEAREWLRSG